MNECFGLIYDKNKTARAGYRSIGVMAAAVCHLFMLPQKETILVEIQRLTDDYLL